MGEYVQRDSNDPNFVPSSSGMNAEQAKVFAAMAGVTAAVKQADPRVAMAQLIAAQTGKSVDEVLAFMGTKSNVPVPQVTPDKRCAAGTCNHNHASDAQTVVPQPVPELLPALQDAKVSLPVEDLDVIAPKQENKVKASAPKEVPADGFVVTEIVDVKDATQAELDQAFPDEDENNWDGHIREGSKVRVTHVAPGSKIRLTGKIGKVTRVIGNEKAKIYEVEFKGQKIAKVRLNKKTGKLERGYENKKLSFTFDQEDIELYS